MTQALTEPETIDVPIELVPDDKPCTAGYSWCGGGCNDMLQVEPGDEEWQEDAYHCGAHAYLPMLRFTRGGWKDLNDVTLMVRHDENEGDDSRPLILIDYPSRECTPAMTAEQARQTAAWLLNAADLLDPLPAGVMVTTAGKVRIGDELLTGDGWQRVTGLLFCSDTEQASIFTAERGSDMDGSDGWDLSLNSVVKVRRPVHGSCAIQFVEPIPGGIR